MSVQAHLNTLRLKHQKLKESIKSYSYSLHNDSTALTDLKKQKLLLKEKIYNLQIPEEV